MEEMEKNFYVNQLNDEDINEIFSRLKLILDLNGKKFRIDYAIQTPKGRYKLENTHPYCTLFLKDFTCYISNADLQVKTNIKRFYRNFMLNMFEGTTYAEEAEAFDVRAAERNAKKGL